MPTYTATINREVTTICRREVVALDADDAEANQKLRDMAVPHGAERADITIVPCTDEDDDAVDPQKVDGVEREWCGTTLASL